LSKWCIIPLLTIIGLLGAFVGWLYSQRPIIEYSLPNCPETFDFQYTSLSLTLEIRNTGNSYSKLRLILTVENANISLNQVEPGTTCNGTYLIINYDLPSRMENYNMVYVNIEPLDSPQNFTIDLTIENLADWSFPGGWICHWLEPHGYITHLIYNRTDTTTYELSH
jgi:hypothetical protein